MAKTKKSTAAKNKSSKTLFWIVGIIALCFLSLIFLGDFSSKEVTIDYKNQPFLGDEEAPVQIIEFGDYKCPACKKFQETAFPLIEQDLINTGKVKFYFMNYPFINVDSERAAQFAETVYLELGNDVFWNFHDLIYKKQPEDHSYESVDLYTESYLAETLGELVNQEEVNQVVDAFQQAKYKEALDKDLTYVNNLGVRSTPTLFINGKEFTGTTFDDMKKMVEEES